MFTRNYEEFTDNEKTILEKYVTNTDKNIFVLHNLPEVIKGALFSRYSRSILGLRSLLLKEFIANEEESHFAHIAISEQDQALAITKAKNFYNRILDGFGDDSIGELGGAHIAIEKVSMLAAKALEDCRIGGSPLEKSTRYVFFDQKVNGHYQYYREPVLMASNFRDLYVNTCDRLFETYSELIPPLTEMIKQQTIGDRELTSGAEKAALRAHVLDCLRGLLPSSALTNLGIFGNGRFFEHLLHKLHCHKLSEMNEIGEEMVQELSKVIPSFVRRASKDHHTHQNYASYYKALGEELQTITKKHTSFEKQTSQEGVRLICSDQEAPQKVAAGLLFENSDKSIHELIDFCSKLPKQNIQELLSSAAKSRKSRREKSPRALELANFIFEIVTDFGAYRDLHRHRMLTQERQRLSCDYGYFIPQEILGSSLEQPYRQVLEEAKVAYDKISEQFPNEAQYIVPMGYNLRWYFQVNLRSLQWLTELRSQKAGHIQYRKVAQDMAREICLLFPEFKCFFQFVDNTNEDLGRLEQEKNIEKKLVTQPK